MLGLIRTVVLGVLVALSAGCAESLHLLERGPTGGISPSTFWPPPPSTGVAMGGAIDATFGDVDHRIATVLRERGYAEARWYPIGVGFQHGFAVTTRLERIDDNARPVVDRRWSTLHRQPPTLRWLAYARHVALPERGRYRAFLIALTDLPKPSSHVAPTWDEATFMEGPGLADGTSADAVPSARRATPAFHLDVYIYEYAADTTDGDGAFVASDAFTPWEHLRGAGLAGLQPDPERD